MKDRMQKFLLWLPRITALIFICFLTLMSLDVFVPNVPLWRILIGLLIHNIPTLILTLVLVIAWKHELVGAVVFLLFGVGYIAIMIGNALQHTFHWYMLSYALIIAGPAILTSIFYFVNWKRKKQLTH